MFSKFREYWRESLEIATLKQELRSLVPEDLLNDWLSKFQSISNNVECPHNPSHILSFVVEMLKLPKDAEGCIVEAGCFKGGSTAKFSLVAKYLGRPLMVFDSFEGLPENSEDHSKTIHGTSIKGWFKGQQFRGSLDEVRRHVEEFGDISVCTFVPGWFEDTLPGYSEKIAAAYLDVDLASSTRTCLQYLYPRIVPRGVLMSQDGDFPMVIDVFDDDDFWKNTVGCDKPHIQGLRHSKMISIVKPDQRTVS